MKKTGVSMGGKIVNAKMPGLMEANCSKCFHRRRYRTDRKTFYCDYYKIDNPRRKKCARYYNFNEEKKVVVVKKNCKECIHCFKKEVICNKYGLKITNIFGADHCKEFKRKQPNRSKKISNKQTQTQRVETVKLS